MILSGLLSTLISNGLTDLAEVAIDKGEDFVKDKIKDVTGIDLKNKDEITQTEVDTIRNNESKLLDLMVEKNRHSEKMALQTLNTLKEENKDLVRASDVHKEYVTADDKFVSRFMPIFTLIFVVLGLLLMSLIVFVEVPKSNQSSAVSVLEMLKVALISVISFYYGNKATSFKKAPNKKGD